MEGSDGDCGSCCLFARSGETGKSGVPGEAGNLKTGSMRMGLASSDLYDILKCKSQRRRRRGIHKRLRVKNEKQTNRGGCASCLGNARFTLMHRASYSNT